jgi:serine/threonine-protein kinase HipA
VDDHLKNFWMLAKPEGYRLAPAFDLVPDISGRGEHTLSFRSSFECPKFAELIGVADEWNVSDPEGIVAEVGKAVGRFTVTAERFETRGDVSVGGIAEDIRKRLERLAGRN